MRERGTRNNAKIDHSTVAMKSIAYCVKNRKPSDKSACVAIK